MNTTKILLISAFTYAGIAFLGSSSFSRQIDSQTDSQIMAMGYSRWIQLTLAYPGHSLDQLEEAERRYAWAQTLENERVIASRPDKEELQRLHIYIADITKSSYIIGDYMMLDKPYDHLYIAKSESLSAITLKDVLANRPPLTKTSPDSLKKILKNAREIHQRNKNKIELFNKRKGGFNSTQLLQEFDRISQLMLQVIKNKALKSDAQKQQILQLFHRLINLSLGLDPLPYPSPKQISMTTHMQKDSK